MTIYAALLALYPRQFRREYGDDMAALLAEQLRDERAARVIARAALDLVVSVPARHLEVHMPRTSTAPLVAAFIAIAAAFGIFGGPLGVAVALLLLVSATLMWRRNRPIPNGAHQWWKLLIGGIALLLGVIGITTARGELHNGEWYVAMTSLLVALTLIGLGTIMGIVGHFRTP